MRLLLLFVVAQPKTQKEKERQTKAKSSKKKTTTQMLSFCAQCGRSGRTFAATQHLLRVHAAVKPQVPPQDDETEECGDADVALAVARHDGAGCAAGDEKKRRKVLKNLAENSCEPCVRVRAKLCVAIAIEDEHDAPNDASVALVEEVCNSGCDGMALNHFGSMHWAGDGVAQDDQKAAELWQRAADMGNADAMANLGWCSTNCTGMAKDGHTAFEWFQRAAKMGSTAAMNGLVWCFKNGAGVEKNNNKAQELAKLVPKAQSTRGLKALRMLEGSHGMARDADGAVALLKHSVARTRDNEAMWMLGVCCEFGIGTEQDVHRAEQLFKSAAQQGNTTAMLLTDKLKNKKGKGCMEMDLECEQTTNNMKTNHDAKHEQQTMNREIVRC